MKKEWLRHYILAFVFLAIVIVSVLMIVFKISLVGFAVYAGDAACGVSVTENSEFSATQSCSDPNPTTGPTITINNVALDCKNYSLTGDNVNGFGIKTTANNSIIKNCRIKSFNWDLNISGENATIIDTNISASATSDANISGIGSGINATFLNVTFTNSKATIGNNARLFVKYYLTINVTWANGTGASGVAVSIYNESANATQASGATDSRGIVVFNATDYIKTSAQQEEYSYNITAISGSSNASNYSNDMSGNTLVLLNLSISADSLSPNLTIASPANITYSTSIIHFNVSLSENISICLFTLNSWQNNVSMTRYNDTYFNYTNSSINDGGYMARFWCNDTSNNANNSEQASFSIDTLKPNLTLVYPSNTSYGYNVTQLNYTLSDANLQACWWSSNNGVNNVTITCGTNITGANSSEGNNTWLVSVNDSAGNLNFSRVTFVKDTTPPLVTIISPTAKNYSTSSIEFNVSLNENSTCLYSLNSGLNNVTMTRNATDTGFNATNSSIADGQYLARFYCNDTAGNWNRSESRAFGIDTIKPSINMTYPQNTSYGYNVTQLNYTLSDANLQACWWSSNNGVNNVTITCGTNITGANSSEGNNTWLVSVNDSAGNVNFSRVTFVKDMTASVLALISPPDGHNTTDTSMIFSYNMTDTSNVTNCSLIVNNAVDQTSSSVAKNSQQNFSRAVSAASYTWNVNCTDALNNIGNSTTRSLTINAQPPQQNTTTGGGGGGSSCTSKWQCSEWTECEDGNQTRTCTDLKKCVFNAQIEKRACVVVNKTNITTTTMEIERVGYCRENWTCLWTACRSGWQDAYNCTDVNICGTNAFEPVNRTCTEFEFPLPNIPLMPAVAVGGGIVVVASFLWLLWLLLFAGLPLFMLRLRHYCLSLIDFDNLLQLDTKINRGMFISLLRQHKGLVYAGARENTERFLLDKGFMELQFDRPCVVNAHFSSLKEADMFKQALIKAINEFSSSMGIDAAHRAELLRDITLVVERQSIFSALRAWRRQKRAERVIKGAIKR